MRARPLIGFALAAALALNGTGAAAADPPRKPMRVMSLMLCADQMAMLLLPPERISSITYVALSGTASPKLDAMARTLRINHGLAEEVLADKPDLIVAGDFSTPVTRRLARQLGIPMIELKAAETFEDVRDQLRLLGDAFGERPRAEALIAHMDATLAELERTRPSRRIVAVGWSGAGRIAGRRSMFNAMLEAAGAYNVASNEGVYERSLDLEQLLALKPRPDILLHGTTARVPVGQRADQIEHPVLARAFGKRRLSYPQSATACGTPYAADAAVTLRRAILAAMEEPG